MVIMLITITILLLDRKCPKNLDTLEPVEQVAKNIWRVLGLNPGSHTLQGKIFVRIAS
jgi:hypothetical protein